jgi:hypothetical protein
MYRIEKTGDEYQSFGEAISVAAHIRSDVIEIETGIRRWTPAGMVSEKRLRQHGERLAAYQAQQRMNRTINL